MNIKSRDIILSEIRNTKYDVAIIGGGAIASAIAYKSSINGLSTILIEKNDYGCEASSKSTKILKGGMYNVNAKNIGEVTRSLRERKKLSKMTNADALAVISPIYENSPIFFNHYIRSILYESLYMFSSPHFARFHGLATTEKLIPTFNSNLIEGSLEYYEYAIDDIRYTLELLNQAKYIGASILNHVEAIGFYEDSMRENNIVAEDKLTGNEHIIKAGYIVNATGHSINKVNNMLKKKIEKSEIDFVKGINLYVSQSKANTRAAILLLDPQKRYKLSVIPYKKDMAIISTSDRTHYGDEDSIYSTSAEVDYMLDLYNRHFNTPIEKSDVITTDAALHSYNNLLFVVREHRDYNYISVEGGSLTLSMHIADKTLEKILRGSVKQHKLKLFNKSFNKSFNKNFNSTKIEDKALSEKSLIFILLYFGYNDILERVENIAKQNPELAKTIDSEDKIPLALIKYFIEYEDALSLEDMLLRRLGLARTNDIIEYGNNYNDKGSNNNKNADSELVKNISKYMASELSWNSEREAQEIKSYLYKLSKNREPLY